MTDSSSATVAVVLGGGRADDPLAVQAGVAAKALAPFRGKPLACYVLEALRDTPQVITSIYVGPTTPAVTALAARVVPAGERMRDSLAAGLEAAVAVPGAARILVTSADLPHLSAKAVADLLTRAPQVAAVYTIIAKQVAEAQFPQQRRTYARFKEGRYTGGNILLLAPSFAPTLLTVVERAYTARKNPLLLARMAGAGVALRFVLGQLRVCHVEARASRVLGAPVRAYISPYAAIGADVDRLEHLTPDEAPDEVTFTPVG